MKNIIKFNDNFCLFWRQPVEPPPNQTEPLVLFSNPERREGATPVSEAYYIFTYDIFIIFFIVHIYIYINPIEKREIDLSQ